VRELWNPTQAKGAVEWGTRLLVFVGELIHRRDAEGAEKFKFVGDRVVESHSSEKRA